MTTEDKQIWGAYTRSLGPVTKKVRKHPSSKLLSRTLPTARAEAAVTVTPRSKTDSEIASQLCATLERKREKAMRQGMIEIDATLDLHGMTQKSAFDALATFIAGAVDTRKRALLIITGKGKQGGGILRLRLAPWLEQLAEFRSVLAIRSASPRHGGSGAFYILLRKKPKRP